MLFLLRTITARAAVVDDAAEVHHVRGQSHWYDGRDRDRNRPRFQARHKRDEEVERRREEQEDALLKSDPPLLREGPRQMGSDRVEAFVGILIHQLAVVVVEGAEKLRGVQGGVHLGGRGADKLRKMKTKRNKTHTKQSQKQNILQGNFLKTISSKN